MPSFASPYLNATPRQGRQLVRGPDGKAWIADAQGNIVEPFMVDGAPDVDSGLSEQYQPDWETVQRTPNMQRMFGIYENQHNQSITDAVAGAMAVSAENGAMGQRWDDSYRAAGVNPMTMQQTGYRLVQTPDGPMIQDDAAGTRYSMNMAPQAALDALGIDQKSSRPDNAAVLPGQQAAPIVNGKVQENVQGNPTQAERDLGTVSTLPGGMTRPPFTPPPVAQPSVQPSAPSPAAQPSNRTPLSVMRMPTNVDYTGSASSIFGAYAGTAGGFQPPQPQQPQMQAQGAFRAPQVVTREAPAAGMVGGNEGAAFLDQFQRGGFQPPAAGEGRVYAMGGPFQPPSTGGIRLLSATPPGGNGGGATRDDTQIPPDPGGGKIWNGTEWVDPPGLTPSTGGNTSTDTGIPPGFVRVPDYSTNPPGWKVVQDPTYRQPPAPPQPAQRAPLYPQEIDQILANTGLTQAQTDRVKALLQGEIDIQHATKDQIVAAIRNSNIMTDAQVRQIDAGLSGLYKDSNGNPVPTLAARNQTGNQTGYYTDENGNRVATLGREQTYGFDAAGNPTLDARRFQHQLEQDYHGNELADQASRRADAGVSGYFEGNATLDRERLQAENERANLTAMANMGNQAAQIRLQELAQQEAQRQFNVTNEQQWRQNPASVFDKVWNNRAGGGDAFQPPAQGQVHTFVAPAAQQGYFRAPDVMQPQQAATGGWDTSQVAAQKGPMPIPDGGWGRAQGGAAQGQQSAMVNDSFAQPSSPFRAPAAMQPQQQTASAATGGFQAPAQQQQSRSPLTYGEIQRAGVEGPGIAAATSGARETPRWQTAGGMPMVSGQAYNRLSNTERQVFDAELSATGNDPNDYHEQRRRLMGGAVRTGGGFSAPRRVMAGAL